jgi:hypothetical protein
VMRGWRSLQRKVWGSWSLWRREAHDTADFGAGMGADVEASALIGLGAAAGSASDGIGATVEVEGSTSDTAEGSTSYSDKLGTSM